MNIIEAGKVLCDGRGVKRKDWNFNIVRQQGSGRIMIDMVPLETFVLIDTDLLADDWEVVGEKSTKELVWDKVKSLIEGHPHVAILPLTVYDIIWDEVEKHFKSQQCK